MAYIYCMDIHACPSVLARLLVARHWAVCLLLIMICVNIVSRSNDCITPKWLDVYYYFHKAGMYVWTNVCMHICFHRALLACALPVTSVRMPARRASSLLLVIARIYTMHVCMLDAMYVCFHRDLIVCTLFSRRACSHALPLHIMAFNRCLKDIFCMYVCSTLGMYATAVEWVRAVCARLDGKVVLWFWNTNVLADERKNN